MLRRNPKRNRSRPVRTRSFRLESLEQRRLLAATPLGVTPQDTGEFLLGTVAVTPVFFESNGTIDPESQNWTPEQIDQTLAKVADSVGWWSSMLDSLNVVNTLDFVIDDTYAVDPVETGYEPIDRSSNDFIKYVGEFVTSRGYGDSASIEEAVRRFNVDQRTKLGTDWAFTIFLVDSSDDGDGLFSSGGNFSGAFAYAGGLFIVAPSTRPASVITHEIGHIFWARDEYSGAGSWSDQRGYYDAENLNAANNPAPGFQQEISIMRGGVPLNSAYVNFVSPESTLAMVGWRDSDGDGILDVADVPLSLDAIGYYDDASSLYRFSGMASAVPLVNKNSSGPQSDITLNRISELQYSLDDGPWVVVEQPDQQVAEFDFSMPISEPFSSIRWRVIDGTTGVVSEIIEGTSTLPALSTASVSGIAFIDGNANGQRDSGESALASTYVVVRQADGSELFGGQVDASGFDEGALPGDLGGATFAADGILSDTGVGSFFSSSANASVFQSFDLQRQRWTARWSSKVAMEVTFDEPVGEVSLQATGLDDGSFARVEAYDASGVFLGRVTSEQIAAGTSATVRVTDSGGRISSIRAYGHAGTSVALSRLEYGSDGTITTDASGAWSVENLPDGDYIVDLAPEFLIHEFAATSLDVAVVSGRSAFVQAAAGRVDSPRHNRLIAEDVSQDGVVTAQDALLVINDLSRFSPRILQASETSGFDVDVNNDGRATALDALLVINRLSREDGAVGEFVNAQSTTTPLARQTEATTGLALRDLVLRDPALGELAPLGDSMFNSAGRATSGESIEGAGADNPLRALLGRAPTTKITDFSLLSNQDDPMLDLENQEIDLNESDDRERESQWGSLASLNPPE